MIEEIEKRASAAREVYGDEHVVYRRHGVCVGDSEDVPFLLARVRELETLLARVVQTEDYGGPSGLLLSDIRTALAAGGHLETKAAC